MHGLQVVQLLGVPKLVNGIREKQSAMLLLQLSKSGGAKNPDQVKKPSTGNTVWQQRTRHTVTN